MKLGNVSKKQAVLTAIANIDAVKPGFITLIKKRMIGNGLMGGWMDDLFAGSGVEAPSTIYDDPVLAPENVPEDSPWWVDLADMAKAAVPAWFTYQKEKDWTEIQLERAKQGLPPVRTQGYGAPATEIAVTHRIPEGAATRALGIDPNTIKQLGIGAAIIGGLIFLSR